MNKLFPQQTVKTNVLCFQSIIDPMKYVYNQCHTLRLHLTAELHRICRVTIMTKLKASPASSPNFTSVRTTCNFVIHFQSATEQSERFDALTEVLMEFDVFYDVSRDK